MHSPSLPPLLPNPPPPTLSAITTLQTSRVPSQGSSAQFSQALYGRYSHPILPCKLQHPKPRQVICSSASVGCGMVNNGNRLVFASGNHVISPRHIVELDVQVMLLLLQLLLLQLLLLLLLLTELNSFK